MSTMLGLFSAIKAQIPCSNKANTEGVVNRLHYRLKKEINHEIQIKLMIKGPL